MPINSNRISKISFHRNLFILLLSFSICIQGIIILFSYFRQNVTFNSAEHFFIIISSRVFIGFLSSLVVAYPFLFIIKYLNKIAPWRNSLFKRIPIQLFTTIIITAIVSLGSNVIVKWLYPTYKLDLTNLSNDIMIYTVSNIILIIVLEAWLFYVSVEKARKESRELKEMLIKTNYETLKNQIEPHFLFNSMSVLSGLVSLNPETAQKFIKEYTSMYRYIIESLEKPVTKLSAEIKFVESYIYLQKQRFGSSFNFSIKLDIDVDKYVLPPMSIQVLIENAFKHNTASKDNPLTISIYNIQTDIYIKNNIQSKISLDGSTHIGQKNLIKRYELICKRIPSFMVIENYYVGILPVLNPNFELSTFAINI